MLQDMYQEYLYVIGKAKDGYKLDVDVEHRNIHTFYQNKVPLFKLIFGKFSDQEFDSILVSFHIDIKSSKAVTWYANLYKITPFIAVTDHYIEDDQGETYLGEDADIIKNLKLQRNILEHWLSEKSPEEIQGFVESKILGRIRDPKKSFDSLKQSEQAILEFEKMKKSVNDEDVH